jgi:hypothetical protein
VKRNTAVYRRASGNSAVAGIPAADVVHVVPVVFTAVASPTLSDFLQSQSLLPLLLLILLLRLTFLLFQEFMLLVAFLLLLGSC